ncbi:hypothetical protein uav_064 [Pseudomonas phage UAVern]|uniref:Uncharacterized protein n=1 Tax=Pseudomonas phage UAVern TaxID=2856997 RepID=A0A975UY41_9CAUD|nr:hypothetical protein uav_064 [Pseudomonas phage UAVern]
MAKQLKIGDKVKIKRSSEYFGKSATHNPANVVGEVIALSTSGHDLNIRVEWPGEHRNSYNREDLKLAKAKAPKPQEDLLAEIVYKDMCDDALEVDTEMRSCVYIAKGTVDSDGDFDRDGSSVELQKDAVKKLRKQLKAWLDKHHGAA